MHRSGHQLCRAGPEAQAPSGKVPNAWFGRDEQKSLMFFTGAHVPQWQSVRKVMPVLLLTQEEVDVWMRLLGMKQRRLPGHFRQMP